MKLPIHLIHGNDDEKVNAARYELTRGLLPGGEEDGEVVDLRGPGNSPLTLDRCLGDIVQELGTVSLIPGMKRVVVVWDLGDFRSAREGSVREARKATAKVDPVARLRDYLTEILPSSDNTLVFIFNEDDDRKQVAKSSALYQFVQECGTVREFSEKRIDWAFEDAVFGGRSTEAVRLLREWLDRSGSNTFRVVTTLNGIVQLLVQARLEIDARQAGVNAAALITKDLRPSLATVPEFKARKVRSLAARLDEERLRRALRRLNDVQKAFFPTGEELVVHDATELAECLLVDLLATA